jgi:hypothetical protein
LPLIEFAIYPDHRGSLTVHELPFDVKRVFWFENVPPGKFRGGHAMKTCQMVVVAMRGSFDIVVDGERYHLNSSRWGLYVKPTAYRVLENFSPDALCLVLASEHFDEDDYA